MYKRNRIPMPQWTDPKEIITEDDRKRLALARRKDHFISLALQELKLGGDRRTAVEHLQRALVADQ